MNKGIFALLAVTILTAGSASAVWYVDKDASGPVYNGTSWATAFTTIQEGIDAAYSAAPGNKEVWVAEGNYNENRTELWGQTSAGLGVQMAGSLVLKDGVKLYGGFLGNETLRDQRQVWNSATNRCRTEIDGATARAGSPAYHVVVIGNEFLPVAGAVLDGFGIKNGVANGIADTYEHWRGAGLYNYMSSPAIANCMFYNNIAQVSGGAIANESANIGGTDYAAEPIIVNCVFWNNSALRNADGTTNPLRGGGAIFNNGWTITSVPGPLIYNCSIANNTTYRQVLADEHIWGTRTAAVYNARSVPTVWNSILWYNSYIDTFTSITYQAGYQMESNDPAGLPPGSAFPATVQYCSIQGGAYAPGPVDFVTLPYFIDVASGNLQLQHQPENPFTSVFIDPVNTAPALPGYLKDLRGVPRPYNIATDYGAFEYDHGLPVPQCQNPTIHLSNGTAILSPAQVDFGSADDNPLPGALIPMSLSRTVYNCADLLTTVSGGSVMVTLTVTDYAGNSDSCQAEVIVDGGAPYFSDASVTPATAQSYALPGNSVNFSVTACGGDNATRTFTWYFDNGSGAVALPNPGAHPSAPGVSVSASTTNLTSTLTVSDLTMAAEGAYFCVLSDAVHTGITVQSNNGLLDMIEPVTVTSPGDLFILTGNPFALSASASGGVPPYSYQWQHFVGGVWNNVPADGPNPVTLYPGSKEVTLARDISGSATTDLSVGHAFKDNGGDLCIPVQALVVLDDGLYRLQATDSSGLLMPGHIGVSAGTTVNIDDSKVNIMDYPQDLAHQYEGDSVSFTVVVIGGHGPYEDRSVTGYGYDFFWDANSYLVGAGVTTGCSNTVTFNAETRHNGDIVVTVRDFYPSYYEEDNNLDQPALLEVHRATAATAPAGGHRNVGSSFTFTTSASLGYSPYTYQWRFNGGSGWVDLAAGTQPSGSEIADVTSPSLTITGLQVPDDGQYLCVVTDSLVTGSGSVAITNAATLTVTELLDVGPTTLSASPYAQPKLYAGEDFTLSVVPSGGKSPYSYVWKLNGVPIPGAPDAADYAVTGADPATHSGIYTCTVDDSSLDPPVTSDALQVDVYANLAITEDPLTPQVGNVGDPVSFSVASTGGWPTVAYQWMHDPDGAGPDPYVNVVDGGFISGATGTTLSFSQLSLGDEGDYKCVVTDGGPGPVSLESASASLTVTNFLKIGAAGQPQGLTVYEGDTATLHVAVYGGVPPYHFAWQKVGVGAVGADADTLTYAPAAPGDAGEYFVTCTDESGVNPAVDSAHAVIAVYPALDIESDPSSMVVYVGTPVTFSVAVSGGIPLVTYQWQANLGAGFVDLTEGALGVTGTTSPTLSIASALLPFNGVPLHCIVTAQASGDPASTAEIVQTSADAVLRVTVPLSITTPQEERAYINDVVDPAFPLSVTITGGSNPDAYEWQRSVAGANDFSAVPGAGCCGTLGGGNSAVLTVDPALETSGYYDYRIQVIDEVQTTYSNPGESEFDTHLHFTLQPSSTTVEPNGTASFHVEVAGGLGQVTYQWMMDDGAKAVRPVAGANITGADTDTLTISAASDADAGSYWVEVNDEGSTISGTADSVLSEAVVLTVSAGIPVTGGAGLLLLAAATALAGVVGVRRRR